MTIEASLNRIADALEALVAGKTVTDTPVKPVVPAPAATPAPAPAAAPKPNVVPMTAPAPAAPAAAVTPFKDVPGLVAYTMKAYQEVGAERGARIQGILSDLGYQNINDVKPEHFGAFHAQIEALRAGN